MTEQEARISSWRTRFDHLLERFLPAANDGAVDLGEAMRYSVLAGGKRFRPVLVYAAGHSLDLDVERLDPLAVAIEFIHSYSLIHDDLPAMDDDDLRRGRPTCHRRFDEATAILAGDALQARAFEVLSAHLPPGSPDSLRAIHAIAAACGADGMAGGQALDLAAVGQAIDEEALKKMHRLKTGALIRSSVTTPGILAGSDDETLGRYAAYGECVGLAFQIHDDILDVTGDSEVTGKATFADRSMDKPTFPSLLGLEESRHQAMTLRDQAIGHLQRIDGDTSALAWLAEYVVSRDR